MAGAQKNQDDTCGSVVLLYRLLHEQAPKAFLFTISCPDSMLQHIFNKYPIPPRRVLDEYMGHRSDQFPILYYRRS